MKCTLVRVSSYIGIHFVQFLATGVFGWFIVRASVCACEREREKERDGERERESVCVCVKERERERV